MMPGGKRRGATASGNSDRVTLEFRAEEYTAVDCSTNGELCTLASSDFKFDRGGSPVALASSAPPGQNASG